MTPEEFCKTYGFMVGDADGNFSAERVLKRAELAAILLRVDNELTSPEDTAASKSVTDSGQRMRFGFQRSKAGLAR